MTENDPLIFISYASPDRERVLPFFEWLNKQGFNVWMDCRRLKPGQNWDFKINRALYQLNVKMNLTKGASRE